MLTVLEKNKELWAFTPRSRVPGLSQSACLGSCLTGSCSLELAAVGEHGLNAEACCDLRPKLGCKAFELKIEMIR